MTRLYDLHTHSNCSDGQLSPTELVCLAKKCGVDVLALTDHDTTAGIAEARAAAGNDLTIIPGIEFSSLWNGRNIHVVGLGLDVNSGTMVDAVTQQGQIRRERAITIAQRLAKAGIANALEGAEGYSKGASIGRPHFAQYMVDKGYVSNFAQAFNRYLGSGKIGDIKHDWPDLATVVQWISTSGGIAVLAHPDKYKLTRTKLYCLLDAFVASGGRALEVISGQQDAGVTNKLARAAEDFSLVVSCGSDFHSPKQSWQMLGKMSPLPKGCQPIWEVW